MSLLTIHQLIARIKQSEATAARHLAAGELRPYRLALQRAERNRAELNRRNYTAAIGKAKQKCAGVVEVTFTPHYHATGQPDNDQFSGRDSHGSTGAFSSEALRAWFLWHLSRNRIVEIRVKTLPAEPMP